MEDLFKELAQEESCEFKVSHQQSYTHLFLNFPLGKRKNGLVISTLALTIPYKEHSINVNFKLADNHTGTIDCIFPSKNITSKFKIEKRSHLWKLITRQKNILKIKCEDPGLADFIQDKLISLNLEQIADQTQFEPLVIGYIDSNELKVSTSFHLAFSEKKEVLKPLIEFYKSLIDKLNTRNKN